MKNTWKPTVAGILNIVAGSFGLILGLLVVLGLGVFAIVDSGSSSYTQQFPIVITATIVITLAIVSLIVSILAIIGGIYALQRKKWGLALTGSIAAFFGSSPLGIAAIVLTALSKNEFK